MKKLKWAITKHSFLLCILLVSSRLIFSMEMEENEGKWLEASSVNSKFDLKLPENIAKKFVKLLEYSPNNIDLKLKSIVVFVFSDQKIVNSDCSHPTYKGLKSFIKDISESENVQTFLAFYDYEKKINTDYFLEQGRIFYEILKKINKTFDVMLLGYGHSGLIIKAAINRLTPQDNNIKLVVLFSVPVWEVSYKRFISKNFEKLLNFYSTSDMQQYLGSITFKSLFYEDGSYRKINPTVSGQCFDIRTQVLGKDADLDGFYSIINKLSQILDVLDKYKYHFDLDLNLAFDKPADLQVQLAIRGEKPYSELSNDMLKEIEFSNLQKKNFKQIYSREISEKANIFQRFFKS